MQLNLNHNLTLGDICEIADITQNVLGYWVNNGAIEPVNNAANGTGKHRAFSTMQAVAAAYGAAWMREGCSHKWVKPIVQFVANMSESEIEQELAAGRTFLIGPPSKFSLFDPSPMLGPEATRDQRLTIKNLDLERCYAQVKRQIDRLAQRPLNGTGRNRGLGKTATR